MALRFFFQPMLNNRQGFQDEKIWFQQDAGTALIARQ